MKHVFAAGMALMVAGCGGAPGDEGQPIDFAAGAKMWGTDANLTPGQPSAILRYADHKRGFGTLRLPKGEGPFPLAVLFHGGCWKAGVADTAYMAPLATHWQNKGIATLNMDYREVGAGPFGGGGWPRSFADWQAATGLVQKVLKDYPIDPAHITLVGHSAGALPALWLAAARGADSPIGAADPMPANAAILLDGPVDVGAERAAFDTLCDFPAVDPFMGGSPEDVPARYAAIAPENHPPRLKEVLTLNAKLPPAPAAAIAALERGGTKVTRLTAPDASHFDIITPGAGGYETNEGAIMKVLRGT